MGSIFFAPLSGLLTAYSRVDVRANNIANLNTPGFKASMATTMDLSPIGTALQSIQRNGQSGFYFQTGSPTDLAAGGDTYFEVRTRDGRAAYTRTGSFRPDSEGYLATSSGERLQPPIKLPAGAEGVFVGTDGTVSAIVNGEVVDAGRVQVVRFNNPQGLQAGGGNLFYETGASGEPSRGLPGDSPYAPLYAGYLEGSNVDLASEMVGLSQDKITVAANVKALRAAEEIIDETLKIGE